MPRLDKFTALITESMRRCAGKLSLQPFCMHTSNQLGPARASLRPVEPSFGDVGSFCSTLCKLERADHLSSSIWSDSKVK